LPSQTQTFEHGHDLEPPTPRSPVSDLALARAAQPQRGNNGRGAMVLIVVLVLLIVVGSTVGFLLFRLFITNG
jgi:hypothetical protein